MQDYPQHLFLSYVLHTYDDPALDWSSYRAALRLTPYSLEYWLTHAFAQFVSIETAGKLLVSLYVLLMGAVVVRAARRLPHAHTPWALLMFFPLIFNQTYFLGFVNFLLSVPLLFLALLDLEDFTAQPIRTLSALRHAAYLTGLFLCHPFSALLYLAFASAYAVSLWKDRASLRRILWPIVLFTLIVATWAFTQHVAPSSENHRAWAVIWWPFEALWKFYAIQFTGMRINNGVDALSIALWSGLMLALCTSALRAPSGVTLRHPYPAWFALALAGYCMLPFWFGYYAYFNLRLAPVSLLVLVMWCAPLRVPRAVGFAIAALSAGLVVISAQIQARVSEETAQIVPIIAQMERNARVLPIYADASTQVLDSWIFLNLHAHDHNYYHIIAGGGANPNLFPNPMLPVQLRPDALLPAVEDSAKESFAWKNFQPYYRYVLVRGAYPLLDEYLSSYVIARARSGGWTLYENPQPLSRYLHEHK
jgi:hypothetical protein